MTHSPYDHSLEPMYSSRRTVRSQSAVSRLQIIDVRDEEVVLLCV